MNQKEIRQKLADLTEQHRDLDDAISALSAAPASDRLQIQRLKKRKLALRDEILTLQDQIIPDIIA